MVPFLESLSMHAPSHFSTSAFIIKIEFVEKMRIKGNFAQTLVQEFSLKCFLRKQVLLGNTV